MSPDRIGAIISVEDSFINAETEARMADFIESLKADLISSEEAYYNPLK
jgi:hypothetical protein